MLGAPLKRNFRCSRCALHLVVGNPAVQEYFLYAPREEDRPRVCANCWLRAHPEIAFQ